MKQINNNNIDFKQLLNIENVFRGKLFYPIDTLRSKRRLAIADIHGCYNTFTELLNKIKIDKDDFLFLLGDYINRGKKSKEVIDKIMELIKNDYKVFPLRGNHEHRLLERHLKNYTEEEMEVPKQFHCKDLMDENNKIKKDYLGLFSNLPYYYELEDFFLVHAGFNLERTDFLEDYDSMIWMNDFEINRTNKRIVVGHKPKYTEFIKNQIENKNRLINLDNGCVYKSNSNLGNLLCFNLDTNELYVQKNID